MTLLKNARMQTKLPPALSISSAGTEHAASNRSAICRTGVSLWRRCDQGCGQGAMEPERSVAEQVIARRAALNIAARLGAHRGVDSIASIDHHVGFNPVLKIDPLRLDGSPECESGAFKTSLDLEAGGVMRFNDVLLKARNHSDEHQAVTNACNTCKVAPIEEGEGQTEWPWAPGTLLDINVDAWNQAAEAVCLS
jgi:hypothetical protein